MSGRLGFSHSPSNLKLQQTAITQPPKQPFLPCQTDSWLDTHHQLKTWRSSQSTEEEVLAQETDPRLLHVSCYQTEYLINLGSKQPLLAFCCEMDQSYKVSKLTKIAIKMVVTKKAAQMNQTMEEQWTSVRQEYEALHAKIFNC